jgi:hypothetical protein
MMESGAVTWLALGVVGAALTLLWVWQARCCRTAQPAFLALLRGAVAFVLGASSCALICYGLLYYGLLWWYGPSYHHPEEAYEGFGEAVLILMWHGIVLVLSVVVGAWCVVFVTEDRSAKGDASCRDMNGSRRAQPDRG